MTNAKDHLKSTTYYSHLHHLSELSDLHSFTKLMILREPGTVLEFSFQGSVREAIKPLHDPMKKAKQKPKVKESNSSERIYSKMVSCTYQEMRVKEVMKSHH